MVRLKTLGMIVLVGVPALALMGCDTTPAAPDTAMQTAQAAQQQSQQNAARIDQLSTQVRQAQDAAAAAQRRADQVAEDTRSASQTTDRMMNQQLRK